MGKTIKDKFVVRMKNRDNPYGEWIRDFRLKAGLSQERLAWKVDLSRSYIQHLESGRTHDLKVSTLIVLCEGLGIQVTELLEKMEGAKVKETPKVMLTNSPAADAILQIPRPAQGSVVRVDGVQIQDPFTCTGGICFKDMSTPEAIHLEFLPPVLRVVHVQQIRDCIRLHFQESLRDVCLDLSKVLMVDSAIVSTILVWRKRLLQAGHRVRITGISHPLEVTFDSMALSPLFDMPCGPSIGRCALDPTGRFQPVSPICKAVHATGGPKNHKGR